MSGIIQLVSLGAQDEFLVGNPTVSFFRTQVKRHTNFSQSVLKQTLQGNPSGGNISTIKLEKSGDMLSYVYLTKRIVATGATQAVGAGDIEKVELYIGGQKIDSQRYNFISTVWPEMLATSSAKINDPTNATPLHFFLLRSVFCSITPR